MYPFDYLPSDPKNKHLANVPFPEHFNHNEFQPEVPMDPECPDYPDEPEILDNRAPE